MAQITLLHDLLLKNFRCGLSIMAQTGIMVNRIGFPVDLWNATGIDPRTGLLGEL
jgi:hypothetical protein